MINTIIITSCETKVYMLQEEIHTYHNININMEINIGTHL